MYISLGGSKGGWRLNKERVYHIFVERFWHDANWTFIVWGALHALYFLPLLLIGRNRTHMDVVAQGKIFPSFNELASIVVTFTLTTFAWIFFRAENVGHAVSYIDNMFVGFLQASNIKKTFNLSLIRSAEHAYAICVVFHDRVART